jgi:hypothetical protein
MSYYGIGDDPRNRFRKLPRVKRSRSSVGNIRGGGSIGLPNRNQLMGAQPPAQRIPQRQQTGGGSSITTGPEQTPPEQEGLLGGLLQAKGAYEGVKEAATGGKNIRNYVSGLGDNDSVIAMRNMFSNTYIPNSADYGAVSDSLIGPSRSAVHQAGGPVSGLNANPVPSALPQNHALQGLAGQQSTQIANQVGQLEKLQAAEAANITNNLSSGSGLGNAANSGITGALPPTELTKAGEVKAQAVTGLKSPPTQGVDKLGVAGAGLGVGLNVHDISQNGLNFANATGLAGSAALGAAALKLGASNYWNPIGWTLLGASAADSIFDIF